MSTMSTDFHEFPDFNALIGTLERMRQVVAAEYDRLSQIIRYSWNDARLTTIANFGGVIARPTSPSISSPRTCSRRTTPGGTVTGRRSLASMITTGASW